MLELPNYHPIQQLLQHDWDLWQRLLVDSEYTLDVIMTELAKLVKHLCSAVITHSKEELQKFAAGVKKFKNFFPLTFDKKFKD